MYNYSGNSAGAEAAINTYDPYFPSQHHVNSVNSSTSSPSVTSSVSNEDYTYQQTVLVLPTRISKNTKLGFRKQNRENSSIFEGYFGLLCRVT